MKPGKLVLISTVGMALTSVAVWQATRPASGSQSARVDKPAIEPKIPERPDPVAIDRSSFQVGSTLMMEGRLGHAVLPAGRDSETFVSVSINADAAKRASRPAAMSLAIAIDRSGSMKGARLANAVDAARTSIKRLRPGDTVSVVAYATDIEVLVPTTAITADNRDKLLAKLAGLRARGDTCISCGITTAMRLVGGGAKVNRLLLLSDGEATAGIRHEDGFRRLAESCRQMGASITTIGVDVDYNERIMAALARESNGRHYFVQDAAALASIFDQEMQSLEQTVASNAEVTLDMAPGVFVDQVFDRSFSRRGESIVVPMGSFTAGEKKTLLVRVRLPRSSAGDRPVAGVALAYDDLADEKAGRCEGDLVARLSNDAADLSPLDGLVSARVSRSETRTTLEKANDLFASGDPVAAKRLVADKRDEMRRRQADAVSAAAPGRAAEVQQDFGGFDSALGGATTGFEPAAGPREGKSQAKQNMDEAVQLAQ